jgi:hypothetical protein
MSRRILSFALFEAKIGLTAEQEEFLNECTDGTWTYDSATGLVDVDGDFGCLAEGLEDFKGVRFGKVGGYFNCSSNKLTSLAGAPQKVGHNFECSWNNLTSLEGAPQEVGGDFLCGGWENELTSLKGAPQVVDGDFNCEYNELTSLEGAPQKVGGYFICDAFKLKGREWNLEGWLKVLREGSPKAQKLILSILSAEDLNKEIQKDPAGMIMKLKKIWNDRNFKDIRSKLVWPKDFGEEADLVGDLDDVGF